MRDPLWIFVLLSGLVLLCSALCPGGVVTNIIVDNNGLPLVAGTYTYSWVNNTLDVCLQSALSFCFEKSFVAFGSDPSGAKNPVITEDLGCTTSHQASYLTNASDSFISVGVRARKYLSTLPLGGVLTNYLVGYPSQYRPPSFAMTRSYLDCWPKVGANTYRYYGNCVDIFSPIYTNYNYDNITIYSFQDANNPVYYGNISRVNWLINQDIPEVYVRNGRFPNGYSFADIQTAVWTLMHPLDNVLSFADTEFEAVYN